MEGDFNERNPGFGLQYERDSWEGIYLHGGYYKNSYNNMTGYAAFGKEWRNNWAGVGLEAGAVVGYDNPMVGVLPYVSLGPEQFNVKTYVMPTKEGAVFGFQARVKVW